MGTRLRISKEETDIMLSLEPSWKSIVQFHENLTKVQRITQEAIWEIFTSERTGIK